MKRSLFMVVCMTVVSIAVLSCKGTIVKGEGEITSQNKTVSDFDGVRIDLLSNVEIEVQEGASPSLEIKTHNNIHEHIITEVSNGKLRVYTQDIILRKSDITVLITTPDLTTLELNGATDAEVKGIVRGETFTLDISGASEVMIDEVNVGTFDADMSGASELDIKRGVAENFLLDVSGAAEIEAIGMKCNNAKVDVSGAGEVAVYVTDKLDVDIAGAGTVDYKGKPEIRSDIAGAGDLRDRN